MSRSNVFISIIARLDVVKPWSAAEELLITAQQRVQKPFNLLLPNTASASVGKGKLHPSAVCISVLLQPAIGIEPIPIRKYVAVKAMNRVRLAAHNRLLRQPEAVYRAAPLRNVPRQGHWDRREAPQALVDHGIEIWEAIERNFRIPVQFVCELALEAEGSWLGELPEEEAEPVAGGVNAGSHVVETFCCFVDVVEVTGFFLEAAHEGEGCWAADLAGFQDIVVCQGGFSGLCKDVEEF